MHFLISPQRATCLTHLMSYSLKVNNKYLRYVKHSHDFVDNGFIDNRCFLCVADASYFGDLTAHSFGVLPLVPTHSDVQYCIWFGEVCCCHYLFAIFLWSAACHVKPISADINLHSSSHLMPHVSLGKWSNKCFINFNSRMF
jgi:hypothetical protein